MCMVAFLITCDELVICTRCVPLNPEQDEMVLEKEEMKDELHLLNTTATKFVRKDSVYWKTLLMRFQKGNRSLEIIQIFWHRMRIYLCLQIISTQCCVTRHTGCDFNSCIF